MFSCPSALLRDHRVRVPLHVLRAVHVRPILLQELTCPLHCSGRTLRGSESAVESHPRRNRAQSKVWSIPRRPDARAARSGARRREKTSRLIKFIILPSYIIFEITSSTSMHLGGTSLKAALESRHARRVARSATKGGMRNPEKTSSLTPLILC